MKQLDIYINEKLNIGSDNWCSEYPETKEELAEIIKERIAKEGNECDLNDIDVTAITDMSELFYELTDFNGDISKWDVSGVKNMSGMFYGCSKFNGDISEWDVSGVTNMKGMFAKCENFNCDISKWDIRNVTNMEVMFSWCKKFSYDISGWDVKGITNMSYMFFQCVSFDGAKLEKWDIDKGAVFTGMFAGCKSAPAWYPVWHK